MSVTKSDARRLAKEGLEVGARVLRGVLSDGPSGPMVDDKNVLEWLAQHTASEVVLIVAPIDRDLTKGVKSCYTCGRDYEGKECPRCASARARLRP
ncbi:MAG TPA: hypothetical protein PKE64_01925 [Anaerolineae bacterium]|nr:hypothetical protein [Anaerolineae bacterium]HMR62744.1 hypothetical protein [Anaerolineae bacterium]